MFHAVKIFKQMFFHTVLTASILSIIVFIIVISSIPEGVSYFLNIWLSTALT